MSHEKYPRFELAMSMTKKLSTLTVGVKLSKYVIKTSWCQIDEDETIRNLTNEIKPTGR